MDVQYFHSTNMTYLFGHPSLFNELSGGDSSLPNNRYESFVTIYNPGEFSK
jgi:hypothetical protein